MCDKRVARDDGWHCEVQRLRHMRRGAGSRAGGQEGPLSDYDGRGVVVAVGARNPDRSSGTLDFGRFAAGVLTRVLRLPIIEVGGIKPMNMRSAVAVAVKQDHFGLKRREQQHW